MRDTELFKATFPPLRWIAQELIPEGVGLFGGPEKGCKSWMLLHWGSAVASGLPVFGRYPTEIGSVLYLGLEDNDRRMYERLGQLYPAMGIAQPTGHLHTYTRGEWPEMSQGGLEAIEAWVKDVPDARMVVIDPVSYFGTIPNGYNQARDYMKRFADLAAEWHLSIQLVAHTGRYASSTKGGVNSRGRTRRDTILGRAQPFADVIYVHLPDMTTEPPQTALLSVSGKDVTVGDMGLSFDKHTGLWSQDANVEIRPPDVLSNERRAILLLLEQLGSLTVAEIADATNRSFDSAKHLLADMRGAGQVMRDDTAREYMTPAQYERIQAGPDPQIDLPFGSSRIQVVRAQ